MPTRLPRAMLLAAACLAGAAWAASDPAALANPGQVTLETLLVTDSRLDEAPPAAVRLDRPALAGRAARSSDTARLLEDIPGGATYGAGAISSLPVIHGLADDRLRTSVDGMDLMSACPNHMNPALSFIDPSKVAAIEVYADVAPVSVGGDSIGGAIQVHAAPPRFAREGEGVRAGGSLGGFYRSNGHAKGYHVNLELADSRLHMSYDQSLAQSDNYRAGGAFKLPGVWKSLGERLVAENEVAASAYAGALNRDLVLALRPATGHVLRLGLGEQRLDYEGFPNQRMDMVSSFPDPVTNLYTLDRDAPANVNRVAKLHYSGSHLWGDLEARLFRQQLRHHMDMLQERFLGMYMPMDTEASTLGGEVKASVVLSERDTLRIGGDFQNYRLDDWWPPVGSSGAMCCNDFWNIRDGKRDRLGLFGEWEAQWSGAWLTLAGLRWDRVRSNAGDVQGYNGTPTYATAANAFNARDHRRADRHLDFTLLARHSPAATQTYELGLARKTRSPNLYERYAWSTNSMAWVMNNFVGDGNGYLGNLDLKPETAHILSLSATWQAADGKRWRLRLSGHATHVRDFINAERCAASVSPLCDATNRTTTNRFVLLQYVNHDARLAGIDLSGERLLGEAPGVGAFSLTGTLGYLRGEDLDSGEPLYHILPLNGKLGLTHRLGGWTGSAEWVLVDAKDDVSRVRNEIRTKGYGLLHLRGAYVWKRARLDLSIENVFDRFYVEPLGGVYIGQGNAMSVNAIPWGMGLPGMGRSVNVALRIDL